MFLILTQPTLQESVGDFLEEELKQNIAAAMATAKCMTGLASTDEYDTAMNFNCQVWQGRTLLVLGYAGMMLESLDFRWPTSTPFGTQSLQGDIAEILMTVESPFELMSLPQWTQRTECLDAMRSHLIHKNRIYKKMWPELEPLAYPMPDRAGISAYA